MQRLWKALLFSLAGLRDAWRQPACRLEIACIAVSVPIALWLPVGVTERLFLIGSVVAMFIVELLNSAIESAVDRIGPERNEFSRVAKDMGSAAVMVTALLAVTVWITLAGPPLLATLSN